VRARMCTSEYRELAACIYGELAAGMETSAAIVVVQGLRQLLGVDENGREASLEKRQGSMLALGYIMAHAVDPDTNAHKLPKETVSSVLLTLTLALSERRAEVVSSAARAIGLAGLHCTLMLPPGKMPPSPGPWPSVSYLSPACSHMSANLRVSVCAHCSRVSSSAIVCPVACVPGPLCVCVCVCVHDVCVYVCVCARAFMCVCMMCVCVCVCVCVCISR
jgi:hypothetical protein